MSASSISSATSSPALSGSSLSGLASPSATRDQFLKLFVAQLEHQNPLDPQSGADMVAQLAQLSSLEQQVQTNKNLSSLLSGQDSQGTAQLAGLVGKDAKINASTLTLDGAPPPIQISADAAIKGGTVTIKNASGATVRTIELPPGRGPFQLGWDGKDGNGAPVPPGSYSISVAATGADGAPINCTPELVGTIDAIELGPDGTHLRIGHALVTPADVLSIGAPGGIP